MHHQHKYDAKQNIEDRIIIGEIFMDINKRQYWLVADQQSASIIGGVVCGGCGGVGCGGWMCVCVRGGGGGYLAIFLHFFSFLFLSTTKIHVSYWTSQLYFASDTEAQVLWHLSNMNVIQII